MKIPSTRALKPVGFAVLLFGALQAHGATQADTQADNNYSYERYRCVVLGDTSACHSREAPIDLSAQPQAESASAPSELDRPHLSSRVDSTR